MTTTSERKSGTNQWIEDRKEHKHWLPTEKEREKNKIEWKIEEYIIDGFEEEVSSGEKSKSDFRGIRFSWRIYNIKDHTNIEVGLDLGRNSVIHRREKLKLEKLESWTVNEQLSGFLLKVQRDIKTNHGH
jgi:hypothetical protein